MSIIDIISVILFYIALFLNTIYSEGIGYVSLMITLILSAILITLFSVFIIVNLILKRYKMTKQFWVTLLINVIWIITIFIGLKSIKIMGASLF